MHGTFNIKSELKDIKIKPNICIDIRSYWLVKISLSSLVRYGWVFRWDGSRMNKSKLEVISSTLLPDKFKTGKLLIKFLPNINFVPNKKLSPNANAQKIIKHLAKNYNVELP